VDDITTSALTVYEFVKNAGLLPLFSSRFKYFKYEEQDLSEFLDDVERARDIIAGMEFDRIEMRYSIDVIRAADTLVTNMSGLKSKSLSSAKTLVKSGAHAAKLMREKGLFFGIQKEKGTIESEKIEDTEIHQISSSSENIKERLTAIKRDWPEFKDAVDNLCKNLEPVLRQLNQVLGINIKTRFEIFNDKSGKFRFRLRAPNNEIIAVSEAYTNKGSCLKGIKSIKTNALKAKIIDKTKK
jgi:uncharacterized protein YegP (UPF0339 family)